MRPQNIALYRVLFYNSLSPLSFLELRLNSIKDNVQNILLLFRPQEGNVLFQQDNKYPHEALALQHTRMDYHKIWSITG